MAPPTIAEGRGSANPVVPALAMETIVLERDGAVATVRLNRPNVLNALNLQMLDELSAAFAQLDADEAVRAIILTGTGPKAFAAGADIAELNALPSPRAAEAQARKGQSLTRALERMHVPVIAAVNGFALGGGCELAMACDIRIASDNARFGQPEVNLGLLPGYGGTQRAARLVGEGMAMYLCLTGEMIDAQEALRVGLVQRVVGFDELPAEAARVAAAGSLSLDDGLALEALLFGRAVMTDDFREGSSAFLEKRKADFKGR